MGKLNLLSRIQYLYKYENKNIIQYLKEISNTSSNSMEDILISYDFQAGTYTKSYKENPNAKKHHLKNLIEVLDDLNGCKTILEVGVGEATSLLEIIKSSRVNYDKIFGFDLSWSRIKYAKKLLEEVQLSDVELFTGDLFNMPLANNSIDLVYTVHTLEPNGGKELEALKELYRVANKYVVLVEPYYEGANNEAKERMDRLGYIKGLEDKINQLGYKILLNKALNNDMNPLNPANIIVIEKQKDDHKSSAILCCPITKSPLKFIKGCYYSEESLLAYPLIDGIPCLLSNNAIIATKFLDD
ncbi:methyltransferase domain-containing protein [Lysinibacillus sp. RSDA_15]|uniref:methyltransferase domain-containing protein n=1 Tax=Lysinibacillus TaxID=400634 RepID=UPI0018CFB908|nr:methyltransferase domain-containing protein [Lysinibacillus sphaericus]MBG9754109.1 hypothetical protein [Lysinibacillus sphaericus]QTB13265.1 methyltransferase domain-containing protein [Lysinibacillus sphaericus]